MKKLAIISLLSLLILSIGCKDENQVYKNYYKNFTDYNWASSKIVEFTPTIEDINSDYDIIFSFRHIYGIPLENLHINVEITTPSGVITNKAYTIEVFNNKDKYLGDCAVDYCDLDTIIEADFKFDETGTYKFNISQMEDKDPLNFVMEVGLIINKAVAENE